MHEIEGFILAGGASSRMGRDKSQLRLGGKTVVERAAIALSAIAPKSITLVGEPNRQALELKLPNDMSIRLRVIPDVPVEKQNSDAKDRPRAAIIGLYTALSHGEKEWLAVLACDLPFVTGELFERLVFLLENNKAKSKNFDAVVPIQPGGRMQPLCALYRPATCLSVVREMLAGDDWSLQKLLRGVKTRFVRFDEISDLRCAEYFFFNVNTREDYAIAEAVLAKT
jgi:molybdopterin-guanine dinucleotide biosynthesis protein A